MKKERFTQARKCFWTGSLIAQIDLKSPRIAMDDLEFFSFLPPLPYDRLALVLPDL